MHGNCVLKLFRTRVGLTLLRTLQPVVSGVLASLTCHGWCTASPGGLPLPAITAMDRTTRAASSRPHPRGPPGAVRVGHGPEWDAEGRRVNRACTGRTAVGCARAGGAGHSMGGTCAFDRSIDFSRCLSWSCTGEKAGCCRRSHETRLGTAKGNPVSFCKAGCP
jgi:hypothetical protein